MKSNIYEDNIDIQKMRQDAIKRVKEMQSRAKLNFEDEEFLKSQYKSKKNSKNFKDKKENKKNKEKIKNQKPESKIYKVKLHRSNTPVNDIFESILKNKDRNIILILILILVGENADTSLILALLYIML